MSITESPRYPLMFGPGPVHRLRKLQDHLGGAQMWAKREDCNSGLTYDGSKDGWQQALSDVEARGGKPYGIPVQSTLDAIRLVGSLEGVIVDPVYEGKSMAGLIDLVTSGRIPSDSNVLYAHLGGQPAMNAYAGLFTS